MAITLPTIVPDGYLSTSGTAYSTTTVGNIDNGVATPDGAFIVAGANSTASIWFDLASMPVGFATMETLTYNIRYQIATLAGDTEVLSIQIFKADGTTPLTDKMQVVTTTANISITDKGNTAFTTLVTTATFAEWNTARLCIYTAHTKKANDDGSIWSIDEVELNGTYISKSLITKPNRNEYLRR